MNFLGSLIGLGGAATMLPGILRSSTENRMRALAAGRGPSAARTMLQQQGAANARNALSVASSQPGGLGLLQGLRSMEEMNRTAGQQAANARVQEQMASIGAAKQAEDERHNRLKQFGGAIAGLGSSFDAQMTAADQSQAAQTAEAAKTASAPIPSTQLQSGAAPPADPNALPPWMQQYRLR